MNTSLLRAEGKKALTDQEKRQEAVRLKVLLLEIDKFIQSLVERLTKPNKSFGAFGTPIPPAETDTKFKDCPKAIGAVLGKALVYRAEFGPPPPQYEQLRSIFDKTFTGASAVEDKYPNGKHEFFYRMRNLMLILSNTDVNKVPECKPYARVINLFMGTTAKGANNYNYQGLYEELSKIVKKIDAPAEKAEIKELIDMLVTFMTLEAKAAMPLPPSSSQYTGPAPTSETEPEISEVDISAVVNAPPAAVGATPPAKTPLTNLDKMKIANIAGQLTRIPEIARLRLSQDELRRRAENIYRRRTGKGRKTYRKKRHQKKSRKARRV